MAGFDDPPTQIGTCGCTGRGRWPTSSNCQRSPWCDGELVGERGPHGVDGLVEQPPAVGERHAERVELALDVPGPDAEDRAAARELVERGPRLGDRERVPVRAARTRG